MEALTLLAHGFAVLLTWKILSLMVIGLLLGVFVGAVMKRSGGRADPRKVNQLLSTRASG